MKNEPHFLFMGLFAELCGAGIADCLATADHTFSCATCTANQYLLTTWLRNPAQTMSVRRIVLVQRCFLHLGVRCMSTSPSSTAIERERVRSAEIAFHFIRCCSFRSVVTLTLAGCHSMRRKSGAVATRLIVSTLSALTFLQSASHALLCSSQRVP